MKPCRRYFQTVKSLDCLFSKISQRKFIVVGTISLLSRIKSSLYVIIFILVSTETIMVNLQPIMIDLFAFKKSSRGKYLNKPISFRKITMKISKPITKSATISQNGLLRYRKSKSLAIYKHSDASLTRKQKQKRYMFQKMYQPKLVCLALNKQKERIYHQ